MASEIKEEVNCQENVAKVFKGYDGGDDDSYEISNSDDGDSGLYKIRYDNNGDDEEDDLYEIDDDGANLRKVGGEENEDVLHKIDHRRSYHDHFKSSSMNDTADDNSDNSGDDEDADDEDCYEIKDFNSKLSLRHKVFDEENDDDVVIVEEKGPVALRDFPHPRHLCANFPFNTTSRESYCSKCYCSLCEVPASKCLKWKGTQGHCNASKRM